MLVLVVKYTPNSPILQWHKNALAWLQCSVGNLWAWLMTSLLHKPR